MLSRAEKLTYKSVERRKIAHAADTEFLFQRRVVRGINLYPGSSKSEFKADTSTCRRHVTIIRAKERPPCRTGNRKENSEAERVSRQRLESGGKKDGDRQTTLRMQI